MRQKIIDMILQHGMDSAPGSQEPNLGISFELNGVNSLSYVTLLVSVESEFGIGFPDETLDGEYFANVGVFVDYVLCEIAKKAS